MSIATAWGTTEEERARPFPCDGLLARADATYFRGVSVKAPPSDVFPWICQLRAAPYSYDWIDNLGRQSPRTLTPGLTDLAAGQRVMSFFEVVDFEEEVQLTARTVPGTLGARLFGDIACTYAIVPAREGSRLIVKIIARFPRGPLGWMERLLLPWGDLIMMRRQLLNLRALAEETAARRGLTSRS